MTLRDDFAREIAVVTPEQVRLTFQTAGIGSRAGAQAVDTAILVLFFLLLAALTGEFSIRSRGSFLEGASNYVVAAFIALIAVVQIAYYVVCECTMGRTVGGRVVGLRVVQDDGRPVTVLSSFIRNLFRLIDFLPVMYVLGATVSFFHPKDKRLGDLLAGTVVIYDTDVNRSGKKRRVEKGSELHQRLIPELLLEESHRRAVTREDWVMLSAFVERLEMLSHKKQLELAAALARHFMDRMELSHELRNGYSPMSFLIALYEQLREDWEI